MCGGVSLAPAIRSQALVRPVVLRSRFAQGFARLVAPIGAASLVLPAAPLALLLAASTAIVLPQSAQAQSRGLVTGSEFPGYGRVVFSFDEAIAVKARLQNTVMIVEFDRPVRLDVEKLATQLPNFVTVARLDPGGMSVRFGLSDRFRPDVKLAGERVFLDLLSPRWQGMAPPLPPEVVADLVKRARAAEEQLKRVDRERRTSLSRDLDLRVGSTVLFKRAIFAMPRTAPVDFEERDGALTLTFDANFRIAQELVRARMAGLVRDVEVEEGENSLRVSMRVADGLRVKGFREDDSFALDFSRTDGQPVESAAETPNEKPSQQGAAPATPATAQRAAVPPVNAEAAPRAAEPEKVVRIDPRAAPTAMNKIIDASFEPGRDPDGFALRIANLKSAPIAILPRGNALLVLIETQEQPSLPTIPAELKHNIEGVTISRVAKGTLIRIAPTREGAFWLAKRGEDLLIQRGRAEVANDAVAGAAIKLSRAFDPSGKEALVADVGETGSLMMIDDPFSGQRLAVVPVPNAGLASAKTQSFPEFSIERTLAGFAVLPVDEAVTITRRPSDVLVGHEIRLNLSSLPKEEPQKTQRRPLMLDTEMWEKDQRAVFRTTEQQLLRTAAESPRITRSEARFRLARFYMANGRYPEAGGVLDVLTADDQTAGQSKAALFHRAFAYAMMGRHVDAARLLAEPAIAMEDEQKLLQGLVDSANLRHAQAHANLRAAGSVIERYPEELQAYFRRIAIESAIETGDAVAAREQLLAYEQIDSRHRNPHLQQLLAGRISEMQGRMVEAFHAFTQAAQSPDRRIEAEARFGRATAGLADGKLTPAEAKAEFETLTAIWRRSETEVKSLARLGEMYAEEGRWREAFLASQRATALMPNHAVARRMEEAMGRRFEALFLDNEADKLPKVEALAIQQEFRSLMPPGRRGDEIARRLADRLFDLDLVAEATEVLEHQVRKRLDGVARASVATRLAVMYLTNRQPVQALSILRDSRLASMPNDLRRARTLLEARALGDLFRTELAIEVLADEKGDDVERLRADIFWKGKKWREAGESYERVLGESWQPEAALSDIQRNDALRAGLAYVLAEEKLSLDRLRSKFMPKMAKTDDAVAFNLITVENFSRPDAFRAVARNVVNADTMTEFLSAYRKRYPESGGQQRPVRSAGEPRQSTAPTTPDNRG